MRYILLATTIAMLCSCGWQLRDAQVVPSTIGSLHVATQLPNREIVNQLTRALNVYGVEVVDAASQADYSVMIIDFRETRRIATLNASARVAEYQLNDDLDFMIAGATGEPLTSLLTASVERSYEIEERDILSSENEERLVKREMREEIVRQILNRLKVLPANPRTAPTVEIDK